ncbi:MAG: helix-turn-helix domain-containing protein, partial [Nanoarchaeota archaeon]|nr:helix-turn-helix domain-containing protein [Nanoarchaeota archaeon]
NGVYDNLTAKENGYWLLDLSTQEKFTEYTYQLNLPKNTVINYLGVYAVESFESKDGFKITGHVTDRPFKITIQYKQELIEESHLFLMFAGAIAILVFLIWIFLKKKKPVKKYHKDKFSDREFMIITLLQKNHGCMTQAELERKTNLPKASLHRNIASLERKGIIDKTEIGMSNKICLR